MCTFCKFNQSGLNKFISCCFWWKSVKFLARICDKKIIENSRQCILSLIVKSSTLSYKILLNFIKICEILVKNSEKRWMKSTEFTLFSRKFKPRYLPVKNENQKIFLIPYSTLDKLSNDTSLNSLRWIYRSAKIDWTKKNSWVYSSSPLKRGRNNECSSMNFGNREYLKKSIVCKNVQNIDKVTYLSIIIDGKIFYKPNLLSNN